MVSNIGDALISPRCQSRKGNYPDRNEQWLSKGQNNVVTYPKESVGIGAI
jgi:hypothetical protein